VLRTESGASKLQIEAPEQGKHVLQLEQRSGAKAVEQPLYIMLLLMIVGFVGFWAYRTSGCSCIS